MPIIDQAPVPVHFRIARGNTLEFIVTVKESGTPIDVSAFLFLLQLLHPRTGAPIYTLTLGAGIEFEPGLGQVRVTITDTQTQALPCNRYPYFFQFTTPDPGGYVRNPFAGKIQAANPGSDFYGPTGVDINLGLYEINVELGAGIPGPPGPGLPPGGSIGQFPVKTGTGDYEVGWTSVAPGGGTDLATLPTYVDDAAAILGGLLPGDFYIVDVGNDAYPAGLPKKVL